MAKNKNNKLKVTSYCVAEEAGVSQSAVSRAYKPGGSVSKATREKVYAAAKKLGYRPNAIARSLISQQSNMIGIVMADVTNPFYSSVLELFLSLLQEKGLRPIVLVATRDQQVDDLLPQLLEYQIDGLVITSATLSSDMASSCSDMGVPVVLFNRSVPNAACSSICCDNAGAAREVARLFIEKKYSRIAYIAGVENTSTNKDRQQGFYEALTESKIKPQYAVGNYSYDGGFQAALSLAEQGEYPQAIFCANDIMAMGAMDAIRYHLKLKIPEDVAVVGFDDIENARWPVYDLTTVRPSIERMVERCIDNLIENQKGQEHIIGREIVSAKLIRRGTV